MKYNKILIAAATLTLGLAVASCNDTWDEHYESQKQGECSMWEALAGDADLSNFTAVLEATGYKPALSSSQVFTVFAPTNASFSAAQRDSVIDLYKKEKKEGVSERRNSAVREFVLNHIALYNHSVSSLTSDSILMMNRKYMALSPNALGGSGLVRKNVATHNGVLYSLNRQASFSPNVFEYFGKDKDLDSVANFIYQYNEEVFIASQSVPGEIKDGKTHYLDSVTSLRNVILSDIGNISIEDSSYLMVVPTNKEWKRLLETNTTYFQYDANVPKRDSLMYLLPRLHILAGTVFSRTINPESAMRDSVMSVNSVPYSRREIMYGAYWKKYYQYDRPYDEGGVFYGAVNCPCSNGTVLKSDNWNMKRTDTFLREIVTEAEGATSLDSVESKTTRPLDYWRVGSASSAYNMISGHGFVQISPSGSANTSTVFKVADVLSNVAYDVYIVALPSKYVSQDTLSLPTKFRTTIYYHDESGRETSFDTSDDLVTDPDRIDSVFVGTYTFPTSSWGLERPQVKMQIDGRVTNSDVRNNRATKTLVLDAIVFKPHDEE